MVKAQRGLPADFDLNVSAPVELGDYLDEQPFPQPAVPPRVEREENVIDLKTEAPPVRSPVPPAREPTARAFVSASTESPAPRIEAPRTVVPPKPRVMERAVTTPPPPTFTPAEEGRLPRAKPPRREINMNAETNQMFEVLLQMVRQYTGQADTKGSELFEALVSLVYRAREELDLGTVPPRGQWGSPTAHAFPVAMSHAFEQAVLNHAKKFEA